MTSNRDWDDIDWIRDRVNREHHQSLTRYLLGRTSFQAELADADGLTASEIVRLGFCVKNGHATVPQCVIRLFRNSVAGVDLALVVSLCRESNIVVSHLTELAKVLKERQDTSAEAMAVLGEVAVRDVMDS